MKSFKKTNSDSANQAGELEKGAADPTTKSRSKKSLKVVALVLAVLLLVSGAVFAGYKYAKKDSKGSDSSKKESTSTTKERPAPAEVELEKARPGSGEFEVDVPEGWVSSNCPDSPNILFLAPTTALLGKCDSEYFGTVAISANEGDISHTEEYYSADDMYSSVSFSAVTVDGIVGYKVMYNVATEGELGYPPVGTFEYIYNLYDSASGKTYRPSYRQLPSDSDYRTNFVEIAESFNKL